ncbi:MAG TPA: MBL fold metallo-hydrolase [Verrucomicrobiae bacterium]|nr:MBL fold metallo-hydrolase [Verrucomicrobiae bacterium]
MRHIVFLGTAAGMPIASSSTSILVEDDATDLLLDVSGGHNILRAFHEAGKDPRDVEHIFISHHDSDHVLGIVPLVRLFQHSQKLRSVYCSKDTRAAIEAIFTYMAHQHYMNAQRNLRFEVVADGDSRRLGTWVVTFFDVNSPKTPQLGCSVTFSDGTKLSYLGDEPLKDGYLQYVENSDVLLHEAFCTSDEVLRFKPYEKYHGTAKEAGHNATKAKARLLLLFHMEDETLTTRKEKYLADAKSSGFTGDIFVPKDLDIVEF